ncbi:hypothetical protein AMAG_05874 [Allomyces macrogynus ATCC 38327]|uniref:Uncharacterized protein n=1 Tax=Allomyces macrogynus (strain ATCC 38327) TaxID=578462 RepID=A0A0L0SDE5_ALLM3|nr:hypothetical protein AMAG_05874 [Allomyces macrogynus ATCC 38327]|eukprot:KNE60491.1 hypothetical protein AMAG_05874 [Allomyces macrogynus ATCC 38327]
MSCGYEGAMAELDARDLLPAPSTPHAATSTDLPPIPALTVLDTGIAMLASIDPRLASRLFCLHDASPAGPKPDVPGLSDTLAARLLRVINDSIPVALLAPLSRAPALRELVAESYDSNGTEALDLEYHDSRALMWNAITVGRIAAAMQRFALTGDKMRTMSVLVHVSARVDQKTALASLLRDAPGKVENIVAQVTIGEDEL